MAFLIKLELHQKIDPVLYSGVERLYYSDEILLETKKKTFLENINKQKINKMSSSNFCRLCIHCTIV